MGWEDDQRYEQAFWGSCVNTYGEETKQQVYAERMGLGWGGADGKWPVIDLAGRSVLDLGGGPVSLLLKCVNLGAGCAVVDPCGYPDWVTDRYAAHGIQHYREPGETFDRDESSDEAWIYNVLQHVEDPEAVARVALEHAPVVRVFEWIRTGVSVGHPNDLTAELLDGWFAPGRGVIEQLDDRGCVGTAWYGVLEGRA